MKIWKISQDENNDWDTYDSAVVYAETPEDAAEIDPSGGVMDWSDGDRAWCKSSSAVTVEYLGEARDGAERGVICASFNAG